MSPSGLPANVERFLGRHIRSAEQLEILLLLHAQADRGWIAEEISAELRIQTDSVRQRLRRLEADRLVVADGRAGAYKLNAGDRALAATVRELAQTYKERRVSIITFIFSRPADDVSVFADAFKLKKEK